MSELVTKAIVFEGVNQVAVRKIQLPEPTADDIIVDTHVSGVSVGTERWALIGKRGEISFPNVPGYMGIGEVVEVGGNAAAVGYEVGQRVNYFASRMVDEYANSWMGSHVGRAVVRVVEGGRPVGSDIHCCELVPDDCSEMGASITGLCAVALRGIEMATIPIGSTVLVSGLGCIGQYAAQVVRLKGAEVCVSEIRQARLDTAMALGADWGINPEQEELGERAAEIAPEGFDIIIDTSSKDTVVNQLFPLLKRRGQFIFQGWYPPPSTLDINVIHGRMPTCYFPCAHSGVAVATAMRWVGAGKLDTEGLITHRAKPEDAPEIYRMIADNSDDFLGIVFEWS